MGMPRILQHRSVKYHRGIVPIVPVAMIHKARGNPQDGKVGTAATVQQDGLRIRWL